jgi:transposase
MGPSLAVVGSTTAQVFEAYVEQSLVPTLKPGQVVILDNLSAHKGEKVREVIESQGCELIYLPAYSSPDFNPIESTLSRRSRPLCEEPKPGLARLWWRRWARRSQR